MPYESLSREVREKGSELELEIKLARFKQNCLKIFECFRECLHSVFISLPLN